MALTKDADVLFSNQSCHFRKLPMLTGDEMDLDMAWGLEGFQPVIEQKQGGGSAPDMSVAAQFDQLWKPVQADQPKALPGAQQKVNLPCNPSPSFRMPHMIKKIKDSMIAVLRPGIYFPVWYFSFSPNISQSLFALIHTHKFPVSCFTPISQSPSFRKFQETQVLVLYLLLFGHL